MVQQLADAGLLVVFPSGRVVGVNRLMEGGNHRNIIRILQELEQRIVRISLLLQHRPLPRALSVIPIGVRTLPRSPRKVITKLISNHRRRDTEICGSVRGFDWQQAHACCGGVGSVPSVVVTLHFQPSSVGLIRFAFFFPKTTLLDVDRLLVFGKLMRVRSQFEANWCLDGSQCIGLEARM